MTRTLHFIDSLGPGGKERQLVELLKGLSRDDGFENMVVVMSEDIFFRELHSLGNVTIRFLLRTWKKDPSIFFRLCRICRDFRPDVLMAWDHMTAVYAIPAVKLLGIRFVNAMIQDAPDRRSRKAWIRSKISFPFSDLILANSRAGLDAYRVPPGRSVVIRNGYDFSRTRRIAGKDETRRAFRIVHPYVVGMVAAFRKTKDQKTLIEAARIILENRDDVAFVFVGDGKTLEECERTVPESLRSNIAFLGRQNDVESIVNVFDVGVLATFTEGISNSIMEYMVLEKPVVATDGGGTKELVIPNRTGFLVKRNDPRELAARILELLENPDLRYAMGRSGRERIEEEFHLGKMTRKYIDLFRNPGSSPPFPTRTSTS